MFKNGKNAHKYPYLLAKYLIYSEAFDKYQTLSLFFEVLNDTNT